MFQDMMDHSRQVKPLRQEGKETICAIYWKDGDRLNYGGTAPIPTLLFSEGNPWTRRIGFISVATLLKEQEAQTALLAAKEAKRPKRRTQRDEEDWDD